MDMNAHLKSELEEIIRDEVHRMKEQALKDAPLDVWRGIDSKEIAKTALKRIRELLELWSYIPCCHTSGMHDPSHFEDMKYICVDQKAKAFTRLCKDLGINPVTRSEPDCCWCNEYLHKRKGEGMPLFEEGENEGEV